MSSRLLLLTLGIFALFPSNARPQSHPLRDYVQRRFHPDVVVQKDVEGIEAHVTDGKLILRVDDFVALVLKNSTDIRVTQMDVYNARNAITAAKAPFDPALLFSFSALRTEQQQSSQISGANTLNSLVQNSQASYAQVLGEGPTVSSSFSAVRSSTNSIFSSFNPSIFDTLNFQVSQPLLQGRGNLQLRAPLLIARTQFVITSAQSKTHIADIISNSVRQYWDAIGARDFIRVQQQSLDLAQKSYEHDKLALELGALSRLDIFQSESQVAQRRLSLIQSQYAYKESLDGVRRLIGADLKPETRYMEILLEDDPGIIPPETKVLTVQESVSRALVERPEITAATTRIAVDDINERVAQNSLLPRLDVSVQAGASGLGGTQYASSGILGTLPVQIGSSGLTDSLGQVFGFHTPYYGMGITLGLPIKSSLAKANLADSLVNRVRDRYTVRQIQQQIILEVKTATNELELAREAVNAAILARDLARKNVDAEQQKYELGTITAFELLDAQTRLTQVESSLVAANIGFQKALVAYERATWTLPYTIQTLIQ